MRGATIGRQLPQPPRLTKHGMAVGDQGIEVLLDMIGFETGELTEAVNLYKSLDFQSVMNNKTRVRSMRHVTNATDSA